MLHNEDIKFYNPESDLSKKPQTHIVLIVTTGGCLNVELFPKEKEGLARQYVFQFASDTVDKLYELGFDTLVGAWIRILTEAREANEVFKTIEKFNQMCRTNDLQYCIQWREVQSR